MEVSVKKIVIILVTCFALTANAYAIDGKKESLKAAKPLEPYIATDEAEIAASGSRQKLEEEKEEQGYSLDLENIEAGESPDGSEFGTDNDF